MMRARWRAVVDAGFDAIEVRLTPTVGKSISSVVKAYGGRALIGAVPY